MYTPCIRSLISFRNRYESNFSIISKSMANSVVLLAYCQCCENLSLLLLIDNHIIKTFVRKLRLTECESRIDMYVYETFCNKSIFNIRTVRAQ